MIIYSLCQDRKELVHILEEKTGIEAKYLGVPSFVYQVGPYNVKRDGTMEAADEEADMDLLRELHAQGIIDNSWDTERETMDISLPLIDHYGDTLVNLIKMFYCRAELISKAIGCTDAFSIDEELVIELAKADPYSAEDFVKLWTEADGNNRSKGFEIEEGKIHFSGFSMTADSETAKAYMDLVTLMNKLAIRSKRVNFEKTNPENERYSFRGWLLRLGMKGDDYKDTRRILLSKLSGNCAFRTKDQAEVAKEKLKAARLNEKEAE